MAKKTRKPIGRSLSMRSQRFTVAMLDEALRQAMPQIALGLDELRANGARLQDYVFLIVDVTHEGSRLLAKDLVDIASTQGGFAGAVPAAHAAKVLRLYEAEAQALQVERPLGANQFRILFSAEGEVTIVDEDL